MNSENFKFEILHYLSKSGDFPTGTEMEAFADNLKKNKDKVTLYLFLRDQSERWESEWRDQFIQIFSINERRLPKPITEEEWGSRIFELIDKGDLEMMQIFGKSTAQMDAVFSPNEAYEEGKSHFQEVATYVPFSFYPFEEVNRKGETAEEYARKTGKDDIADFLQNVIKQLSERWKAAYSQGRLENLASRVEFVIDVLADGQFANKGTIETAVKLVEKARGICANYILIRAPHGHGLIDCAPIYQEFGWKEFEWEIEYGDSK